MLITICAEYNAALTERTLVWIFECAEHYKLAYQVLVIGFTLALNETFFMEGLMKWSSLMIRSGVGWISELWKGPFGEWRNQNGCYGNHAVANVSENVFDLDWWNLALPQFDYIRHVNRRGLAHGQSTCWYSQCFVMCLSVTFIHYLAFLTWSHFC